LYSNGDLIQRIPGEYIAIHHDMNYTEDKGHDRLNLNVITPTDGDKVTIPCETVIDIPFWFRYKNPIPMCCIQHDQLEIRVQLRPETDVIYNNENESNQITNIQMNMY